MIFPQTCSPFFVTTPFPFSLLTPLNLGLKWVQPKTFLIPRGIIPPNTHSNKFIRDKFLPLFLDICLSVMFDEGKL